MTEPVKRCVCTGAESPECHEICVYAGHEDGICEQCATEEDDGEAIPQHWDEIGDAEERGWAGEL